MNQSTSQVSALVDIITDPKKALAGVGENPGWFLLPFLLVLGSAIALIVYYFQTVDFEWFKDQMMQAAAAKGQEMPPEALDMFSPTMMIVTSVVGTAIVLPVVMALTALFWNLVNKSTSSDERGFGSWFALTAWSAVPSILASIAALVFYLMSGTNQIGLEELQFFSANALITHYPAGHSMATIMNTITPFLFWSLALSTLGIMQWTKRALIPSLIIAVIPTLVAFGIMAAFV